MPGLTNIEELELVNSLRSNETEGMELLWDHYAAVLYGLIFRMVQMDEIAEELLLETFKKTQANIGQYEQRNMRLIHWMIRIAHQLSIEKIKSVDYQLVRRSSKFERGGLPEQSSSEGFHPESTRIKDIVRRLDPEHRQIINLFYLEGMNLNDVAKKRGETNEQCLSMVKTSVQKLRHYFEILS